MQGRPKLNGGRSKGQSQNIWMTKREAVPATLTLKNKNKNGEIWKIVVCTYVFEITNSRKKNSRNCNFQVCNIIIARKKKSWNCNFQVWNSNISSRKINSWNCISWILFCEIGSIYLTLYLWTTGLWSSLSTNFLSLATMALGSHRLGLPSQCESSMYKARVAG